ncbi:MAG: hypothetical protein E6I80_20040 [Chloroflexi bacterium]|nr:MAG: hypothetical protein E6I80_20040 [Chloroflexota bacterium]
MAICTRSGAFLVPAWEEPGCQPQPLKPLKPLSPANNAASAMLGRKARMCFVIMRNLLEQHPRERGMLTLFIEQRR